MACFYSFYGFATFGGGKFEYLNASKYYSNGLKPEVSYKTKKVRNSKRRCEPAVNEMVRFFFGVFVSPFGGVRQIGVVFPLQKEGKLLGLLLNNLVERH